MTQTSSIPATVTIDRLTILRAFDNAMDVDMDLSRKVQLAKLGTILNLIGDEAYNSFHAEWVANSRAGVNMDCFNCQGCENGDGCYREYESYTN